MGDRKGYRDPQDQPKKLFIGGLSYETTEDGLKEYFSGYGTIKDVVVIKDPETKKSRGFGFVTFEEISNVDAAQSSRPHTIEGKEVDTKIALSRDSRDNKEISKMFVGGLAKDTTEEQMREAFEKFGEVKSISIIKDKNTQEPRGFGFVEYTDFDYVDKCLAYNMVLDDQGDGPRFGSRNQTNKYKITVNDKKVDIKKADEGGRGDRGPGGRGGGRGGMQQYGGGGGYGGGYDMGGGYGGTVHVQTTRII